MKNMTKKFIALLITAVMVLGTCAVTFAQEAEEILGDWYLSVMEMYGMEISMAEFGMEMLITFEEDGTVFSMMSDGVDSESDEGTWVMEDGSVVYTDSDGAEMTMSLNDEGALVAVMEEDGEEQVMVFTREKPEQAPFEPGEVIEDAEFEDFIGEWNAIYMVNGERRMAYSSIGMEWILSVTESGVISSEGFGEEYGNVDTEYTAEVTDGVLLITPVEEDSYDEPQYFVLTDGGFLKNVTEDYAEAYEEEIEEVEETEETDEDFEEEEYEVTYIYFEPIAE